MEITLGQKKRGVAKCPLVKAGFCKETGLLREKKGESPKGSAELKNKMENAPVLQLDGDAKGLSRLTREQLAELEDREKTPREKLFDGIILVLPILTGILALMEYLLLPSIHDNPMPYLYSGLLILFLACYTLALFVGIPLHRQGRKKVLRYLRYKAPLYSALLVVGTLFDIGALKTEYFTYPLVPSVNSVLYALVTDWKTLAVSALHTLRLMMSGYALGVIVGLATGITCGYSRKVRYWIDPIIKFMGPIPISAWVPIIMAFAAKSLSLGNLFVVFIGVWFSVTVASMAGVSNVDRSYFDAAKILGASQRQLIFRVAIPHAMPNIMAGMTQGMSTACTAIMVAEMLGVKAGLGWYMTWQKAWSLYNNMFASLIVIFLIFTVVTKILNVFKKRVLRWQIGVTQ